MESTANRPFDPSRAQPVASVPPGSPHRTGVAAPASTIAAGAAPPPISLPIRLMSTGAPLGSLTSLAPRTLAASASAPHSSLSSLSSLSALTGPRALSLIPVIKQAPSAVSTRIPLKAVLDRKTTPPDPHVAALSNLASVLREPLRAAEKIKLMKDVFSAVRFRDLTPPQRRQIVAALLVTDNEPVIRAYWSYLPSGLSVARLDALHKATLRCCSAADSYALESFYHEFCQKLQLDSAGITQLFSSVLSHRPALPSSRIYQICSSILEIDEGISAEDFVRTTLRHSPSTRVETLEKLYM